MTDCSGSLFAGDLVAVVSLVVVCSGLNGLEECTVFLRHDHVVVLPHTCMYRLDLGPWMETITSPRWQPETARCG